MKKLISIIFPSKSILILFIIALALRLAYVLWHPAQTFMLDEKTYHNIAVNLLLHKTFSMSSPDDAVKEPSGFVTPGYPLFVSAAFAVFGIDDLTAVRVLQVLISSLTILLIYHLASLSAGTKIAFWATLFWVFYPPDIWVNSTLMTETLFTFLALLFLLLAEITTRKHSSLLVYFLLGIILGGVCMVRAILAFFPLVIIFKRLAFREVRLPRLFLEMLMIFLGSTFILSPWIIRNYRVFHHFVPFSTESGNPAVIGSYIHNKRTDPMPYGKNELETDCLRWELFHRNFKKNLREQPFRYAVWYLILKPARLWMIPYGVHENWNMPQFMDDLTVWYHFLLFLTAATGIIISLVKRDRAMFYPVSYLIYSTVIYIPYLTLARYGFPMTPVMCLLSAYAIGQLLKSGNPANSNLPDA